MLFDPMPNDPQDAQVAAHFLRDRADFNKTAKQWTKIYAMESYSEFDDPDFKDLVEMGFDKSLVKKALLKSNGNREEAVEFILTGNV